MLYTLIGVSYCLLQHQGSPESSESSIHRLALFVRLNLRVMALINCPECNREISDKASACPYCGNPMGAAVRTNELSISDVDDKEYIFCPKCLSTHIHSEQKGFSGGKALVGAVAVGAIGLLAGTIGSKKVKLTCLKCGCHFLAGEAFVATHKKKNEIIDDYKEVMLNKGRIYAVALLKEKYNWSVSQAGFFCDLYLKGHKEFEAECKKRKEEREVPLTIKDAKKKRVKEYLDLLLGLSVALIVIWGVVFQGFGLGFVVTFLVLSSLFLWVEFNEYKKDIKRLMDTAD